MTTARVLLSTGSLHLLDIAHSYELAAEAGFDGMEIMCDHRYSSRNPDYLRTLSDRYRLPALVCHTPFSPQLMGWQDESDEVARISQTLQLAESLQAETIVVHVPRKVGVRMIHLNGYRLALPWGNPYAAVKQWIETQLPTVQAGTPVKIGLENMPARQVLGRQVDPTWWNEIPTWSQVHDWLTLDTTHWGTKGIDPLDAYQAAKGRVCHIHLSNYDGREHRLPDQGRLDLDRFLRALAVDGYAGTISLEVLPEVLEFADEAALRRNLRRSVDFCRANLG
ncbi:MAG: sugar phosphate isomerase/epimerase [Anaerolineae bacterium]|nr:sugar phosphate isomerase/epimerase [Anaerolineae bacterium]